jgi:hypothetical protein
MRRWISRQAVKAAPVLVAIAILAMPQSAMALKQTECSPNKICYCIEGDLKAQLDAKIATLRALIAAERGKGKIVGYISVPLSTYGGGYMNLNKDVSDDVKARLERRFGKDAAWLLSPAIQDAAIPNGSGADYMYMWTQLLEGKDGFGTDFDFVYFVGPGDFGRYLQLPGRDDLKKVGAYFDNRVAIDPDLDRAVKDSTLSKPEFRQKFVIYYGLRASVAFSRGAHDEWNIVHGINAQRRSDKTRGIGDQLPIFFDGMALTATQMETGVSKGYTDACKP